MTETLIIGLLAGIIHTILRGEARNLWFWVCAGSCAFVALAYYVPPGGGVLSVHGGVAGVLAASAYAYGMLVSRVVERLSVRVIGAFA